MRLNLLWPISAATPLWAGKFIFSVRSGVRCLSVIPNADGDIVNGSPVVLDTCRGTFDQEMRVSRGRITMGGDTMCLVSTPSVQKNTS